VGFTFITISKEGIINAEPRKNKEIRANQVRLIDEAGKQVGVVSNKEALDSAYRAGLDLIEISTNAKPPVCRIMDYGKYKYGREKKLKESQKNQHQTKLKEIKFTPRISEHDFGYRSEQAKKFIIQGNRVRASVFFKGREVSHKDRGEDVLNKLIDNLKEVASVDRNIKFEGRYMSAVLVPIKR
jgi:translation initiation factor IF-3